MMRITGIGGLGVTALVKRIDECLLPDDREPLLNYLEILEYKLNGFMTKRTAPIQFYNANGTTVLLKVWKRMITDEVTLRMLVNIFDMQKTYKSTVLDFLKFGGLELLNKTIKDHAADVFLMSQAPNFKKSILATGGAAAVSEIEHEGLALQLCQRCQETVERARRVHTSSTATRIPKSSERVNRVLMFMDSYPDKAVVISAGLDALIFFARNSDSRESIEETTMIASICHILPNFKDDPKIVWRCFLCFHQACAAKVDLAYEMVRYKTHELLAEIYPTLDDPRIQQQLLWLLNIFVSYPKTQVRIHISPQCVELMKNVIETREHLISSTGTSVKDKYLPYKVVVPLKIRQFYRDIKGEVLQVAPEQEESKVYIPPRKKYEKDPKFGTSTKFISRLESLDWYRFLYSMFVVCI